MRAKSTAGMTGLVGRAEKMGRSDWIFADYHA